MKTAFLIVALVALSLVAGCASSRPSCVCDPCRCCKCGKPPAKCCDPPKAHEEPPPIMAVN